MNRPKIQTVAHAELKAAKKWMDNPNILTLHDHTEGLTKIDMAYPLDEGGNCLESSFAASLFMEGTKSLSHQEISDAVDATGGKLSFRANRDFLIVSLFALSDKINELGMLASDMLENVKLVQDRLDVVRNRKKSIFIQNQQKTNIKARKLLLEKLFGENTLYGKQVQEQAFDAISIQGVEQFLFQKISEKQPYIVIAGDANINYAWLPVFSNEKLRYSAAIKMGRSTSGIYKAFLPDAIQTSLSMGLCVPHYPHPDFLHLRMVVHLFAGYFGSRLMQNLREDKGYTYGVGGGVISLKHAAYISISGDFQGEYTKEVLEEVKQEMLKMQHELVSPEELKMAKNNYLGEILRSMDGVFEQGEWNFNLLKLNRPHSFISELVASISSITPETIQQVAKEYFNIENWTVSLCGNEENLKF